MLSIRDSVQRKRLFDRETGFEKVQSSFQVRVAD
jgi:hypothetical protein